MTQLIVKIDDQAVKELMRASPKIFNAEFNRGLGLIGGAFFRKFAKERLGKGGIRSRRKSVLRAGSSASKKEGGVAVPKAARLLGFHGRVIGKKTLERKEAFYGAPKGEKNKMRIILLAHEKGATIQTPFVLVRNKALARRLGIKVPRGKKAPFPIRPKGGRVVIKARLGFHKTWRAFVPEARRRLGTSLDRAAKRAIDRANKAKLRAVARGAR